jgi:CheY-like chemotaxis protein
MKNILVIDDNATILNMTTEWLRVYSKEWGVLTAPNGKLGVELMGTTPVDLVLTDLDMPVMDGYEVLAHAGKHYPSVPLLVMTADCDGGQMERLRSMGITEVLSKPFDLKKLAHRIEDYFGKKALAH